MVRDLNLADRQVWLQVDYRKIWCPHCDKTRVEYLSFCDSPQRLTHRLRRYIYDLCKKMPITEVAEHLDLDPKTVKAVDQEFLQTTNVCFLEPACRQAGLCLSAFICYILPGCHPTGSIRK